MEIFKENEAMKLIDKDALVAEIDRRIKRFREEKDAVSIVKTNTYKGILSFLNTLEVKEVDLDFQWFAKEMDDVFDLPSEVTTNTEEEPLNWEYAIAKHFFELGLNTSNPLTWEDIRLIAEIGDKFMNSEESDNLSEEDYYKEILKRFKAQKRE